MNSPITMYHLSQFIACVTIAAKQWPVLDLATIMKRLGHRSVDILKIDVVRKLYL